MEIRDLITKYKNHHTNAGEMMPSETVLDKCEEEKRIEEKRIYGEKKEEVSKPVAKATIDNFTYSKILSVYKECYNNLFHKQPYLSEYHRVEKKFLRPLVTQYGAEQVEQMVRAYFTLEFYKESKYSLKAWQTPAVINQIIDAMPKARKITKAEEEYKARMEKAMEEKTDEPF